MFRPQYVHHLYKRKKKKKPSDEDKDGQKEALEEGLAKTKYLSVKWLETCKT